MKTDRFDVATCLGLIVLTIAIYAPTTGFDFVGFDDDRYVTENPLVLGALDLESAGKAFTRFRASNWHPLTWLSHMADVSLFGLDGGAHHAVNVTECVGAGRIITLSYAPIPEASTGVLLALGLIGLAAQKGPVSVSTWRPGAGPGGLA